MLLRPRVRSPFLQPVAFANFADSACFVGMYYAVELHFCAVCFFLFFLKSCRCIILFAVGGPQHVFVVFLHACFSQSVSSSVPSGKNSRVVHFFDGNENNRSYGNKYYHSLLLSSSLLAIKFILHYYFKNFSLYN